MERLLEDELLLLLLRDVVHVESLDAVLHPASILLIIFMLNQLDELRVRLLDRKLLFCALGQLSCSFYLSMHCKILCNGFAGLSHARPPLPLIVQVFVHNCVGGVLINFHLFFELISSLCAIEHFTLLGLFKAPFPQVSDLLQLFLSFSLISFILGGEASHLLLHVLLLLKL